MEMQPIRKRKKFNFNMIFMGHLLKKSHLYLELYFIAHKKGLKAYNHLRPINNLFFYYRSATRF
ncbi:protein of unknown function [Petrocella atlantisensis]|uniref:Uncharacterized protein n=1 Tax=Petrocella atlantisensis TaxID=2173034 RepID=A0A3P7PH17_9FIRM|nr:protein of unknown function [Petrocella atlantisensis]